MATGEPAIATNSPTGTEVCRARSSRKGSVAPTSSVESMVSRPIFQSSSMSSSGTLSACSMKT
jgi:hypothetical protein